MKSKLILSPFIFISLASLILFAILGIPSIISTIYKLNNKITNDITGILIPILLISLIFYLLIKFMNCFPKLNMNEEGIKFSTFSTFSKYNWCEIEKIELTGKKEYGTFFKRQMEAITFYFKNDSEKNFWIDQYSNSSEIRVYLENKQKSLFQKVTTIENTHSEFDDKNNQITKIDSKEKKIFNNDHILSDNRIFIYIIVIINFIFTFKFYSEIAEKAIISIIFINILFLILFGFITYTNNYFIITEKNIIVKNNIWFWKQKLFRIADIKEVAIEQHHRTPILLRIITKNYKTYVIAGSGLKNSTWEKLSSHLMQKNIKVRNEIKFK